MTISGIDGNWVLHRIFYTQRPTPNFSQAIAYRFLQKICSDSLAAKSTHLVCVFDGSEVFRYDIFPEYKAQRGDNSKVYEHLPFLRKYLRSAGIHVVQRKKFEGDDVLCALANRYGDDHKVVIHTRDKDSYQYLRPNVTLYDSSFKPHPRVVTHKMVPELTGLPPRLMIQYQALVGDGVDNVPKLLTPAPAKKGLLAHGSISAWAKEDKVFRKLVKANRAKLMLNRELVTLRADSLSPDFELQAITKYARTGLPSSYYDLVDRMNPKTKALF